MDAIILLFDNPIVKWITQWPRYGLDQMWGLGNVTLETATGTTTLCDIHGEHGLNLVDGLDATEFKSLVACWMMSDVGFDLMENYVDKKRLHSQSFMPNKVRIGHAIVVLLFAYSDDMDKIFTNIDYRLQLTLRKLDSELRFSERPLQPRTWGNTILRMNGEFAMKDTLPNIPHMRLVITYIAISQLPTSGRWQWWTMNDLLSDYIVGIQENGELQAKLNDAVATMYDMATKYINKQEPQTMTLYHGMYHSDDINTIQTRFFDKNRIIPCTQNRNQAARYIKHGMGRHYDDTGTDSRTQKNCCVLEISISDTPVLRLDKRMSEQLFYSKLEEWLLIPGSHRNNIGMTPFVWGAQMVPLQPKSLSESG